MTRELVPILDSGGAVLSVVERVATQDYKLTLGTGPYQGGNQMAAYFQTPYYALPKASNVSDPFAQHAWFRAILDRKADALASVPVRMIKGVKGNRTEEQPDYTFDKWARLFTRPNPDLSWQEFISIHIFQKRLYGQALWVSMKDGEPSPIDKANEINFLDAAMYQPKRNEKTKLVEEWIPRQGSKLPPFPAVAVHAFRVPHPYVGDALCPPWKAAGLSMNVDVVFEAANLEFGKRGFSLGGWIIGKEWDKNSAHAAQKVLTDRFAGADKAGTYAVLGGMGSDIQIIPNTSNHKNMEFIEGARFNLEKLLAIEGVPLSWVSKGGDLNNSTLVGEDAGAWLRTIEPELAQIEEYFWFYVFSKIDNGRRWMAFDRDAVPAFRAARMSAKLEDAKKLQELHYPVNIINEKLALGMPRVPWLDEAYANGALLPVSFIEKSEETFKEFGDTSPQTTTTTVKTIEEPENPNVAASAKNASTNETPRSGARASSNRAWKDWVERVLDPNEARFKKEMVAHFSAQRRAVLANLDRTLNRALSEEEIEAILFDIDEWNQKLLTRTQPIYRQIVGDATTDVAADLGGLGVWSESNPVVTGVLAKRGALLVSVNATTRDALRESLVAGSQANETAVELAARINAVFNDGMRARASAIARTETASTTNEIRAEAMKAEGIERHQWESAGDEATRESHLAVNGEIRVIGEPFSNGLTEPGDASAPPEEVVNCRCRALPVLDNPT
jgi:SPP1 gp7 family putative phage head morphogenesis protein